MSYFPRTSAQLNAVEMKVAAPISQYEAIKAKIDRGINRQVEGDKEVAEGLREMIQTKAYLKHYKSIAAFVENEYGKGRTWLYERIKVHLPIERESISDPVRPKADTTPDKQDKKESVALKQVEAAREAQPDKPAVKPTENGKPKYHLAIWTELGDSLFGRALNRIDELNRLCPNPQKHATLLAATKGCRAILDQWRDTTK